MKVSKFSWSRLVGLRLVRCVIVGMFVAAMAGSSMGCKTVVEEHGHDHHDDHRDHW